MKHEIIILTFGLFSCVTNTADKNTIQYSSNLKDYQQKDNFKMREILDSISIQMLRIKDYYYSEKQIASKWIGTNPATIEEIKKTEDRLNINLPQDYRDFILTSNGFHAFSTVHPTFHPIDKIDYLKNIDPELIAIWKQGMDDVGRILEKSIIIAGIKEEQSFLLIPPDLENDKWRYWEFASWIPGEVTYDNLTQYFKETLDFLKNKIE